MTLKNNTTNSQLHICARIIGQCMHLDNCGPSYSICFIFAHCHNFIFFVVSWVCCQANITSSWSWCKRIIQMCWLELQVRLWNPISCCNALDLYFPFVMQIAWYWKYKGDWNSCRYDSSADCCDGSTKCNIWLVASCHWWKSYASLYKLAIINAKLESILILPITSQGINMLCTIKSI